MNRPHIHLSSLLLIVVLVLSAMSVPVQSAPPAAAPDGHASQLSTSDPAANPSVATDPTVDLIFAMDTSGSMYDEFAALCAKITDVVAGLRGKGITVNAKILGIHGTYQCATTTVTSLVPGGTVNHEEDWGPAVRDLSTGYLWSADAVRMIVPMSDEGPEDGNSCYDPGNDRDAIVAAIAAARANQVIVSPVLGSGWNSCISGLAEDLATGTGGRVFFSTNPAIDLADGIAELVLGATKPDPLGEQAPTALPDFSVREINPRLGGAPDEAFTWTHPDIANLADFQLAYHKSRGTSTLPLTVNVPRYFGDKKALLYTRLIVCFWDIDKGEDLELIVNNTHVVSLKMERNAGYACRSVGIDPSWLNLPSGPGELADPLDPSDSADPPTAAANTFRIVYSSQYKSLVYGLRLIVIAARPVILVPGFSTNSREYDWGKVEERLKQYGVPVERPCDFDWEKDSKTGEWFLNPHNPRCLEKVSKYLNTTAGNNDQRKQNTGLLSTNGKALGVAVSEVKTAYGVDKVNLVGHSKGGLLSREYAESAEGRANRDVENLVTISTPHRGAWGVDVALKWKTLPDVCATNLIDDCDNEDLEWGIDRTISLVFAKDDVAGKEISESWVQDGTSLGTGKTAFNASRKAVEGIRYHSIVATAAQETDRWLLDEQFDSMNAAGDFLNGFHPYYSMMYTAQYIAEDSNSPGESDIAVSGPSQRMANMAGYAAHEKNCVVIGANHSHSSKDEIAGDAVAMVLGLPYSEKHTNCEDSPADDFQTGSVIAASAAAVENPKQYLEFEGTIDYGESMDVLVPVDGSHLNLSAFWAGDSALDMKLIDPTGTEVSLTVGRSGAYGFGDIPTLEAPAPGIWTVRWIAPAAGEAAEGTAWELFISQRSSVAFGVEADQPTYPKGVPVALRARLVEGSAPVLGATVTANVRGPDYTEQSINLLDDGLHGDVAADDGIYGAEFAVLLEGDYEVSATASGTLISGVQFMRQDTSNLAVLPAGAHFSGQFSDAGVDIDGDGLFDRLQVTAGVAFDDGGEYEVVGYVSAPDGQFLGSFTAAVTGAAGATQEVILGYDASILADRPADGPVVLSDLILIHKPTNFAIDRLQGAYATQAYNRLDFAAEEVRRTGAFTDQGVDTNSDAAFDYLEVQVPVTVRRDGQYTATLLLRLSDGNIIETEAVTEQLMAGTHALAFRFGGPAIAKFGLDGPYEVRDLWVQGPLGLALFEPVLGDTAAYAYTDFVPDMTTPVSSMTPLVSLTTSPVIDLAWSATDAPPSAGIAGYDVQYRIGANGEWTDWLQGTVLTSYSFGAFDPVTVEYGITYYFRVRARDSAQNVEAYPEGEGDTHVTVVEEMPFVTNNRPAQSVNYGQAIDPVTVVAVDLTGNLPLSVSTTWSKDGGAAQVGLPAGLTLTEGTCTPQGDATTCIWDLTGRAQVERGAYIVTVSFSDQAVGASSTDIAITVEGHLIYLPLIMLEIPPPPPPCAELLTNGDAEADAAWVFPFTASPASYSETYAHGGARSMRVGVITEPDVYSYSSSYQGATAPDSPGQARLTFWWYPVSDEPPAAAAAVRGPGPELLQQLVDGTMPVGVLAGDWQYVLLLDETNAIVARLMWTRSGAAAWQEVTLDVPDYTPGRSLKLWFGVYNDGNGRSTAMYVDDVSLSWCPQ